MSDFLREFNIVLSTSADVKASSRAAPKHNNSDLDVVKST